MLKHVMPKVLENHYTGGKAIPHTFIEFIQLLQNDFFRHYLHFMQQRLVQNGLLKDPRKQNFLMLSIVKFKC